jgi:hypothetical protein
MEQEASLPCSQEPAFGPCLEPDESNPHPQSLFLLSSLGIEQFGNYARFQVLTMISIKMAVFWDDTPCNQVVDRRFGYVYFLHRGDYDGGS